MISRTQERVFPVETSSVYINVELFMNQPY